MNWPQWIVVALCAMGFVYTCVDKVKDKALSSSQATAWILFLLGYYGFYACVLHEGGFW